MNLFFSILIAAMFCNLALANITADSLTYKHWAHQANDEAFVAEFYRGGHEVNAARTRWEYLANLELLKTGAAGIFEVKKKFIDMITEEFKAAIFQNHVNEAQVRETLWRLRATAIENGKPEPIKEIAKHFVELRKKQVGIVEKMTVWVDTLAVEATDLLARANQMKANGGTSQLELNYYLELDQIARLGIIGAKKELETVKELLKEAEADYQKVMQSP